MVKLMLDIGYFPGYKFGDQFISIEMAEVVGRLEHLKGLSKTISMKKEISD